MGTERLPLTEEQSRLVAAAGWRIAAHPNRHTQKDFIWLPAGTRPADKALIAAEMARTPPEDWPDGAAASLSGHIWHILTASGGGLAACGDPCGWDDATIETIEQRTGITARPPAGGEHPSAPAVPPWGAILARRGWGRLSAALSVLRWHPLSPRWSTAQTLIMCDLAPETGWRAAAAAAMTRKGRASRAADARERLLAAGRTAPQMRNPESE